jgi:predicted ATPase
MRLRSFRISKSGPVQLVDISDMADVVVLAGPNGVGKTTLINAIMAHARDPRPSTEIRLIAESTTDEEIAAWGKRLIDTQDSTDCNLLKATLRRNQRRNRYQSSVLNFDSDRAIRNIQSYAFSWEIGNPLSEELGWDVSFNPLQNRYNDVRHSLFRLVEGQKREIAETALTQRAAGRTVMQLDFPDVLKDFKDAFYQLLAPKELIEVDTKSQVIFYSFNNQKLPLDTLSSGEKEVVNIVFDFLLRGPRDSIIVFDEPELHLHPELSYKLLQTLARIGQRNQFIFCSHSPEIISASLENTVIFVTPPRGENDNQAIVVNRDDETHHALQTLGQSIGIISLGKKLILVEGEESSLDKQTYGAILRDRFPEFVLVPVGGKATLLSFDDIHHTVLNKTIWGVEFYLLCDRDAVNIFGRSAVARYSSARIRVLPRYHLENYFLDADTLAAAFEMFEPEGSWLRNPQQLEDRLQQIARGIVPYAVALTVTATAREQVGNISVMPKDVLNKSPDELVALVSARVAAEHSRVTQGLDATALEQIVRDEYARLMTAIDANDPVWRSDIPGRVVFNTFAGVARIQSGRLKQLYIKAANVANGPFKELISIFSEFRSAP